VDVVAVYRSAVAEASVELLAAALDEGPLDWLTFTSSSTVRNFVSLLARADNVRGRERIAAARVACIGPITADTAREHGLRVDVVPRRYTVPDLARAILSEYAGTDGRLGRLAVEETCDAR
jgi:uroporphyrinogen III methyltransferase/synthase